MVASMKPVDLQRRQILNSNDLMIILKSATKFKICGIWDNGGVGYRTWGF